MLKINLPKNFLSTVSQGTKKAFFGIAFLAFLTIVWAILQEEVIPGITTIAKVKGHQIWPSPFSPIARFVANMDWETQTVSLDASMSKAYRDSIKKHLWRIDDGTGIVSEQQRITHTFRQPGYYTIKLSIIDEFEQSDEATCEVLIPPVGLEKVDLEENMTEETKSFTWIPEGTFFNYIKLDNYDRVPGTLKSHYISSDCGLSNQVYNIDASYTDLASLNIARKNGLEMLFTGILELVSVSIIGFFALRYLRKWAS